MYATAYPYRSTSKHSVLFFSRIRHGTLMFYDRHHTCQIPSRVRHGLFKNKKVVGYKYNFQPCTPRRNRPSSLGASISLFPAVYATAHWTKPSSTILFNFPTMYATAYFIRDEYDLKLNFFNRVRHGSRRFLKQLQAIGFSSRVRHGPRSEWRETLPG